MQHRADLAKTFAYTTVPASRYPDATTASGYRDEDGEGDFRLIDITDPANPRRSDWGIQDIGGPFDGGQGCDADPNYGHGAEPSDDGRLVFVAYWDSGFVALDVTDPAVPIYRGRTSYPANADGDATRPATTTRLAAVRGRRGLLQDVWPRHREGFGYLRVYDYSDLAAPVQIGEYRTPNSMGADAQGAGDYSIRNALVVGTDVYVSWYSDGVRVLDASDPQSITEVAYFVPPAVNNPVKPSQRGVLSNAPQVWGVVYDAATGLIFASDMNSGLWILQRTD